MNHFFRRELENAWGYTQNALAEIVTSLNSNFSAIDTIVQNSPNDITAEIQRRINDANTEFMRLQARSLRQSMEARLIRQQRERLLRPRRDSDSSSSSDSSDIDLDFFFPNDYSQAGSSTDDEVRQKAAAKTNETSGDAAQQPSSSTSDSSSSATDSAKFAVPFPGPAPRQKVKKTKKLIKKAKKAPKRKATTEIAHELPAKRTMATSTDDLLLHFQ